MNKDVVENFICPNCGSVNLALEDFAFAPGAGLDEGRIICSSCHVWYRVEHGIADLLPLPLRRPDIHEKFAKKHKLDAGAENSRPAPSKGDIEQMQFFKENVNDYESKVVNSTYYRALDHIAFFEWIKRRLSPGDRVLDLGCGTGRQCMMLAQNNIRTVGMDISEEMLMAAKKKMEDAGVSRYVDLIVADAKNPPVRDGLFDACVFYGTLHHITDPARAILNASKKIKRGGFFFSLDPHASPVRFIFDLSMKICKLYDEKASGNPLFSESQLKQWLSASGINCTTSLSTYMPPHLCYMLSVNMNIKLLKASDSLFNRIRPLRRLAGVIISEGVKD